MIQNLGFSENVPFTEDNSSLGTQTKADSTSHEPFSWDPINAPKNQPKVGLGHITKADPDCEMVDKDIKKKAMRLDLACGNNKKEGYIGVDISPDTQADYLCDLNSYPWRLKEIIRHEDGEISVPLRYVELKGSDIDPIADNSVYEIHCSHYIEHTEDIKRFMEEIYRILIPGGRVTFYAPYYTSIRAMQDFTHKRFISEATFLYFNKAWMDQNRLQHYGVKCNFAILSTKWMFEAEWNTRGDDAKEWARRHVINSVSDIEVILQAIKETPEKSEPQNEDVVNTGAAIVPDMQPEGETANGAH